jgi:hypothetical protein
MFLLVYIKLLLWTVKLCHILQNHICYSPSLLYFSITLLANRFLMFPLLQHWCVLLDRSCSTTYHREQRVTATNITCNTSSIASWSYHVHIVNTKWFSMDFDLVIAVLLHVLCRSHCIHAIIQKGFIYICHWRVERHIKLVIFYRNKT